MTEKNNSSWETFLNPETLRFNLIAASVYISVFEVLKNTIVDRIRDFYTNGFNQDGWIIDPKYETTILSKNRSPVYASLEWLKEMNAIDDADITTFEGVKKLRNELAHALTQRLHEGLPAEMPERIGEMFFLVDKIERWWIVNVEIPTDPDMIDREIDESAIIPGPSMGLRMLFEIALGPDEESKKWLDAFTKLKEK
jgi:hypothetical protein